MKTFKQLQESENGQIYNTSPKTYKEWEDPEILIVGFGRMLYSQLKDKINRYPQQYAKELKRDNWGAVQHSIENMFLVFGHLFSTLSYPHIYVTKVRKTYYMRNA